MQKVISGEEPGDGFYQRASWPAYVWMSSNECQLSGREMFKGDKVLLGKKGSSVPQRMYPRRDLATLTEFLATAPTADGVYQFTEKHGLLTFDDCTLAPPAELGRDQRQWWLHDIDKRLGVLSATDYLLYTGGLSTTMRSRVRAGILGMSLVEWLTAQSDIRLAWHLARILNQHETAAHELSRFVKESKTRHDWTVFFQIMHDRTGKVGAPRDFDLDQAAECFRAWWDTHDVSAMTASDREDYARRTAKELILSAANAVLRDHASLVLTDPGRGYLSASFRADDLLGHLWLQVVDAVTGGSRIRTCKGCGRLMDVIADGGSADRRFHEPKCYHAWLMRECRKKAAV